MKEILAIILLTIILIFNLAFSKYIDIDIYQLV